MVRDLITGDRREAHASRLKFYADSSLNMTENLSSHVAHKKKGMESPIY